AAANERLRDTALAQPALFVVERALAERWMSCGIAPAAMAGHSIGEYVAAQLAGVFSLEDALRVVAERGRLMASCPRGVMIAVPLSETLARARLAAHPACALAVINGPAAVVVAGPEEDVARFEADLARDDIASRRLHTSHAFHSAMMDPILAEFEACLRSLTLRAPEIPFVSNVTGTWITAEQATSPRYWVDQLRGTVRFADGLAVLTEDPDRVLLEVGPGRSLSSAVRSVSPRATAIPSLPGATSGGDDARAFGEALGKLWAAGADVDWRAVHSPDAPGRIPLPTYPFERERAWVEPGAIAPGPRENEKNPDLSQWFWVPTWKRIRPAPANGGDDSPWLVIGEDSELGKELVRRGEARGVRVFRARPATAVARADDSVFDLDPTNDTQWLEVLNALASEGALPGRVIHLSCFEEDSTSPVERGFHSLVSWWKAAGHHLSGDGLRLVVATRHLFDVTGDPAAAPERATLIGFCRVAPQELPGTTCRLVDVANEEPADVARMLEAELDAADTEPVVARRGGHRWAPAYESVRTGAAGEDVPGVRRDGVYVVTGGAGELEAELSRRLAAAGARSITWLSARGPTADLDLGGTEFVARDIAVTDSEALADALRVLRDRHGRIDAVFHTAGEIGGGMLQRQDREDAHRILAPRLAAGDVARHLRGDERLVNVSSTISATGVFGQSDYCAGSTYLEALALARRDDDPDIVTVGFGMTFWDRWTAAAGGGGEALLEELHAIREEIGITVEEGVEALWRALTLREPVVLVSPQDLDELVAESRAASMSDVLEGVGGVVGGAAVGSGDLRSDTERAVAAVWTELLGVPDVGRDDNFLELGGNSLLAIQLASRLRKTFDIDLAIASLFESQNLAQLAGAVDAALEERHASAEILRLLEEIEDLSEDEIRAELERGIDAGAGE
ncbi:MAG: SDR family NAD(P)-dependent oxidoreductase, partial [Gemmatimonadetes bacterium]|nr:SDR family NAD(P)-dependent oxidoreductase [Gemmatimonadota bacterium]